MTGDVGRGIESARPEQGGPSRRSGAARHTDGVQLSAVVAWSGLGSVCCWVGGRVVCRGGELGVLRVREHPLNVEVHPLTAKSTPSK